MPLRSKTKPRPNANKSTTHRAKLLRYSRLQITKRVQCSPSIVSTLKAIPVMSRKSLRNWAELKLTTLERSTLRAHYRLASPSCSRRTGTKDRAQVAPMLPVGETSTRTSIHRRRTSSQLPHSPQQNRRGKVCFLDKKGLWELREWTRPSWICLQRLVVKLPIIILDWCRPRAPPGSTCSRQGRNQTRC